MRRLLVAAPAALLLLTACAASDPVAERRSAVAAITGAANDGDVDGVRNEVSDLLSVLREQVASGDLDRTESDRLESEFTKHRLAELIMSGGVAGGSVLAPATEETPARSAEG